MIRTNRPTDDHDFPSPGLMRTAHALADASGQRSRPIIEILVDRECSAILGAGDRREMLDAFFDGRLPSQHLLLEGLGLSRTSTDPCVYSPGTWSLSAETVGGHYIYVLSGIRGPNGAVVSARMTARVYQGAGLAWRAIAEAAGLDPRVRRCPSDWRRLWNGFDYRTPHGEQRRSPGICLLLWQALSCREGGVLS